MASPEFQVSPEQWKALESEKEQLNQELEKSRQQQEALAKALQAKEQVVQPSAPAPIYTNISVQPSYTPSAPRRVSSDRSKRGFWLGLGGAFAASLFLGTALFSPDAPTAKVSVPKHQPPAPQVVVQQAVVETVTITPTHTNTRNFSTVYRTGKVTSVQGAVPVPAGATCTLLVQPSYIDTYNCRARLTCDTVDGSQVMVYGDGITGYGHCDAKEYQPINFVDVRSTPADGDGVFSLDLQTNRASLADTDAFLQNYRMNISFFE
jgi:hypothetical protein